MNPILKHHNLSLQVPPLEDFIQTQPAPQTRPPNFTLKHPSPSCRPPAHPVPNPPPNQLHSDPKSKPHATQTPKPHLVILNRPWIRGPTVLVVLLAVAVDVDVHVLLVEASRGRTRPKPLHREEKVLSGCAGRKIMGLHHATKTLRTFLSHPDKI